MAKKAKRNVTAKTLTDLDRDIIDVLAEVRSLSSAVTNVSREVTRVQSASQYADPNVTELERQLTRIENTFQTFENMLWVIATRLGAKVGDKVEDIPDIAGDIKALGKRIGSIEDWLTAQGYTRNG